MWKQNADWKITVVGNYREFCEKREKLEIFLVKHSVEKTPFLYLTFAECFSIFQALMFWGSLSFPFISF